MHRHLGQINLCRQNKAFIDAGAIAVAGNVALCRADPLFETFFQILSQKPAGQLQCPARILNDLNRLDARELIKEPAAARVHEHGVALDLLQFQHDNLLVTGQVFPRLLLKKSVTICLLPIQYHPDIVIPRLPWVLEVLAPQLVISFRQPVPEPVQGARAAGPATPDSSRHARPSCSRSCSSSARCRGRSSRRCSR